MSESSTRKEVTKRFSIVYFFVVAFAFVVIGKILYLQTVEHGKWSEGNAISQRIVNIEPDRGDICSSDGRILSTSVPHYEIRMDMKCPELTNKIFNANIDSLGICMSRLFRDKPASEYKRMFISARYRGDRYFLIKRKVDYIELKAMKTFPIFRLGQFKGGFIYKQTYARVQPFGNLASRTIGYVSKEGGVKVGLEAAYDEELRGEMGAQMEQRIAGNYWMPVNDENLVEPVNGYDLITTIDANIQDVAYNALRKQLSHHGASHGTAILMEVETGDVKAITNLKKNTFGDYSESYNFAIGERTEPGSTFKLPALMAAFEDGYIELEDSVDTGRGEVWYHDHPVRDTREEGYGKISVQRIFEVSSNVGVTKIITKYYGNKEDRFVERLRSMGINQRTGIELDGEPAPYLKSPGDSLWSGISLPQMAYGYEVAQTPLQILTFYNAVANDGKMMKPRFVKRISNHGDVVRTVSTEVLKASICSRKTIKKAKKMLEGVVEEGTATNLKNPNYKIAGKTGTAQIANRKFGYSNPSGKSYQASFVGYFPADNPKYSCIVVVNAPSSGVYYGNLVAGTVFKEIADKVYATNLNIQKDIEVDEDELTQAPYSKSGYRKELDFLFDELGIETRTLGVTSDWVGTSMEENAVGYTNRYLKQNIMPNVKGMSIKDALFILENMGIEVSFTGRGSVKQQSVQPGGRIFAGNRVTLTLS